ARAVAGLHRGTRAASARTSRGDRKSTRLNSSHDQISYAVFCLKKKNRVASYHPHKSGDRPGYLPGPDGAYQAYHPFFFFNDTATTEIYTLSLHDALPI